MAELEGMDFKNLIKQSLISSSFISLESPAKSNTRRAVAENKEVCLPAADEIVVAEDFDGNARVVFGSTNRRESWSLSFGHKNDTNSIFHNRRLVMIFT